VTLLDLLTDSVRALAAEIHKLNRPVPDVYFVQSGEFIKIGFTNNLELHLGALRCSNPTELEVLALLPGPRSLERRLHSIFAEYRERGEWFRVNDKLAGFLT
jgi:hypothetical protein